MPATHSYSGIASSYIAVKRDAKITSFAEALDFLQEESGQTSFRESAEVVVGKGTENIKLRVLQVNSEGRPTEIGIKLYETIIVSYRDDETFTTNSGGYITPTTTSRIAQFTPSWAHASRGNRAIWISGFYADKNANRFRVHRQRDDQAVIGPITQGPGYKRKSAKTAHGTLSWKIDSDGNVYSFNDSYPREFVFPLMDFEGIGQDEEGNNTGDFTGPIRYDLTRESYQTQDLRGLRGVAKSEIPLELVNVHRKVWGMPPIELV